MQGSIALLYIGSLSPESNSYRRSLAFCSLCKTITAVNTVPYILAKYVSGVQHHFNIGPGIFLLNRRIRKEIDNGRFDIVLVDNKSYVRKKTLAYIRKKQPWAKIVNLITDDPFGKYTRSFRIIKKTVAYYDLIFVQREVNIEEFKKAGAKRVEICYRSYDKEFNKPYKLNAADTVIYYTPVGFIGSYENVRASFVAYLIKNNIPVTVTGNGWPEGEYWDVIQPYYKGSSVYGDSYIKSLSGMDIALHFLRHANRDEQDSRTFEIPASKVFMIGERSDLHERLFKENEEAVFFSTKEELLEKVKYYSNRKEERERIAENGYQRCVNSGYDHHSRLAKVLETIQAL